MTRREVQRSAGIDVSAAWIDAERASATEAVVRQRWPNTASGHRQLARWLMQGGARARVVLEATGTYSLDLALRLHQTPGIEVMVINPRVSKDFAGACGLRARTDATAAHVLREYAARMPFTAWQPPSAAVLEVRAVMRRVATLVTQRIQEQNRLHAVEATEALPSVVRRDVREQIKALGQRIVRLERAARALVERVPTLGAAYRHLRSVKGIGQRSALGLLGELAALPPELSVRQWVAYAGLDPRPLQSGSSVHPPVRISKRGNVHLRRTLFMPALVALRWEPAVRRFAQQLTDRGRAPLQVLVAIMRKLLHAIYGMLKTDTDFDGERFRRSVPVPG